MKFRRKSAESEPTTAPVEGAAEEVTPTDEESVPETGHEGPYDADDVAEDGVPRVDLGSLLVPAQPGTELRVQVDENSDEVQAVLLAGVDGALEFRAFAAPRNGDLWSEVRPQIAEDMAGRGARVSEREGRFGPELLCELPVAREDGQAAVQPSRVIGINGPRWMLRATLIGRPALDVEGSAEWEQAISTLVVRRGDVAMPVGEPLPVELPADARQLDL